MKSSSVRLTLKFRGPAILLLLVVASQKYCVVAGSSGVIFIPNFVKTGKIVQHLKRSDLPG